MAHEIETFTDGTAAFASARTDAWHQLGTVTRDCLTPPNRSCESTT